MATQGNYVNVPGSNANWAAGLSGSLEGLSKTLLTQSEAEKERLRKADETKLGEGRFAKTHQLAVDAADRQRDRDIALDAKDKEGAIEDTRRWNFDYNLRKKEAEARAQEAAYRRTKEAESKAAQKAVWDFSDPTKQTYALTDYSEPVQRAFNELTSKVSTERDATEGYLRGTVPIEDVLSSYGANISTSGMPKKEVDRLVKQRGLELRGLRNELNSGMYGTETVNARISKLLDSEYTSRLAEVDEKVRTGAGLTQDEKINSLLRRVPENLKGKVSVAELKEQLKSAVQGPSRDSLLASEKASVATENEATLKNIELYDKFIERSNDARKGGNYTSDSKGVVQALKDMGTIDIGWSDNEDANEGFEVLVDAGISPEIAAASIAFGIEKGLLGKSFPSIDSDAFTKLRQTAEMLQKGRKVDKTGRTVIDNNAYTYKPKKERSLDEIQRGLIKFKSTARKALDVDPSYSLTRELDTTPALVNRGPYGAADQPTPPRPTIDSVLSRPIVGAPIDRYKQRSLREDYGNLSKELATVNRHIEDANKDGYRKTRYLGGYLSKRDELEYELQKTRSALESYTN